MTATYTWDIFTSVDGFGSHHGDWGGYWGKEGPELLEHRRDQYAERARMIFGASTYRAFVGLVGTNDDGTAEDWGSRMMRMPLTVLSSTLSGSPAWPGDATAVSGDTVDVVRRLKEESDLPLRSHGSLSVNRTLMAAGLVDRVQLTVFPVITGQTGQGPIFQGAADFDLELLESRTLDGRTLELTYRPTRHGTTAA